ncbi:MAG: hypothetical protein JXA81_11325 [Sedimentisphaerales bacterium]|nr:hypothetical protein [Sedimentisphaerales bacterium]
MTRRKFIRKLIVAGSAIVAGASWFINKTTPRKFIRAVKFKKYPGLIRPMGDISKQGKWSG